MSISAVGANAAIQYATQAPAAMKGEAVRAAAQVLVARKAMDAQGGVTQQLIESATGVGKHVNIRV